MEAVRDASKSGPDNGYRITAKGKKQLASDLGRWERIVEAVGR